MIKQTHGPGAPKTIVFCITGNIDISDDLGVTKNILGQKSAIIPLYSKKRRFLTYGTSPLDQLDKNTTPSIVRMPFGFLTAVMLVRYLELMGMCVGLCSASTFSRRRLLGGIQTNPKVKSFAKITYAPRPCIARVDQTTAVWGLKKGGATTRGSGIQRGG